MTSTPKRTDLKDWLAESDAKDRRDLDAARRAWASSGKTLKESLCRRAKLGTALAEIPLQRLSLADLHAIDAAVGRLMDGLRRLGRAFQTELTARRVAK